MSEADTTFVPVASESGKDLKSYASKKDVVQSTSVKSSLVTVILLWWVFSAMFSAFTKTILHHAADETGFPFLVAFMIALYHLIGGSVLSLATLWWLNSFSIREMFKGFSKSNLVTSTKVIGLLHAFSTLGTNLLVVYSSVSTTLAYEFAEPIFVVLMLYFLSPDMYRKEVPRPTLLVFFAAIFAGAVIAAYEPPFDAYSFAIACFYNLSFGTRTIMIKNLRGIHKADSACKFTMLHIFASCCVIGSLYMIAAFVPLLFLLGQTLSDVVDETNSIVSVGSVFCYTLYTIFSLLSLDRIGSAVYASLKAGEGVTVFLVAAVFLSEELGLRKWIGLYIASLATVLFQTAKANVSNNWLDQGFIRQAFTRWRQISLLFLVFVMVQSSHSLWVLSDFNLSFHRLSDTKYVNSSAWTACVNDISNLQVQSLASAIPSPPKKILIMKPVLRTHADEDDINVLSFISLGEKAGWDLSNVEICYFGKFVWAPGFLSCTSEHFKGYDLFVIPLFGPWGTSWLKQRRMIMHFLPNLLLSEGRVLVLSDDYIGSKKKTVQKHAGELRRFLDSLNGYSIIKAKDQFIFGWKTLDSAQRAQQDMSFVKNIFLPDPTYQLGASVKDPTSWIQFKNDMHHSDVEFLIGNTEDNKLKTSVETIQTWFDWAQESNERKISFRFSPWEGNDASIVSESGSIVRTYKLGKCNECLRGLLKKIFTAQVIITNLDDVAVIAALASRPVILVSKKSTDGVPDVSATCANHQALGFSKVPNLRSAVAISVKILKSSNA